MGNDLKLKCVIFLLVSFSCGNSQAVEYKKSLGLGFQYGLLGGQVSAITALGKSRASLGIRAFTVGHEFILNEKVTEGVQAFNLILITQTVGRGISANYYFDAVDSKGWLVGLEATWYKDKIFNDIDPETLTKLWVSFGYTF